jgi:hypothetical protein
MRRRLVCRIAIDPSIGGPAADRTHGVGTFDAGSALRGGLDPRVPAGRNEPRCEVGERRQDEEPLGHRRMRDLQQPRRSTGVDVRGQRLGGGRTLDGEPRATEQQQVEVELARPPPPATPASGLALEALQLHQQARRANRGVRVAGNVERHGGIQEVRLIGDADGPRPIQPGYATDPSAWQCRQGRHGAGQGSPRVTDVRPEPDVRANASRHGHLVRSGAHRGYSRPVQPVAVRILHPSPLPGSGALELSLVAARAANAQRLARGFREAGTNDVRTESGRPDGTPFGARLRGIAADLPEPAGLVVLGSGAMPLARARDLQAFVAAAASGEPRALANSFYSADAVAIGSASAIARIPDLASDNALPRWLREVAGFHVDDLRRRWRLAIDLDSPLDVILTGGPVDPSIDTSVVRDRLARVGAVALDRRAELVVAGRTSAATLRWLERSTASRTRALIEERGLRAAAWEATAGDDRPAAARPPRSALGLLLDDHGPEALGRILGELGNAALIDSRVLLAHRLGPDEHSWPPAEDRFASDLLLPRQVADPWLRALTASAREASIPVVLGGHTLVGPGVRLALGRRR